MDLLIMNGSVALGQWPFAEVRLEPMRARSERSTQDIERALTGTGA